MRNCSSSGRARKKRRRFEGKAEASQGTEGGGEDAVTREDGTRSGSLESGYPVYDFCIVLLILILVLVLVVVRPLRIGVAKRRLVPQVRCRLLAASAAACRQRRGISKDVKMGRLLHNQVTWALTMCVVLSLLMHVANPVVADEVVGGAEGTVNGVESNMAPVGNSTTTASSDEEDLPPDDLSSENTRFTVVGGPDGDEDGAETADPMEEEMDRTFQNAPKYHKPASKLTQSDLDFMLAPVNVTRLQFRIDDLAAFDRKSNGYADWQDLDPTDPIPVTRIAWSSQDIISRRRIKKWMKEAGLEVEIDEIGNMFGIWKGKRDREKNASQREGAPGEVVEEERDGSLLGKTDEEVEEIRKRQELIDSGNRHLLNETSSSSSATSYVDEHSYVPPMTEVVSTGSHIDTQRGGGRFDGVFGVLGAIEAVHSLRESGFEPERSIEVIVFAGTESVRFGPGTACLGSRMMAGKADRDILENAVDVYGYNILQAVHGAGYGNKQNATIPGLIEPVRRRAKGRYGSFIELHVETGRVLQDRQYPPEDGKSAYDIKMELIEQTEKEHIEREQRQAERKKARQANMLAAARVEKGLPAVVPEEQKELMELASPGESTMIAIDPETETRTQLFEDLLPEIREKYLGYEKRFKGSYNATREVTPSYLYNDRRQLRKMADPQYYDIPGGNIGLATAIAGPLLAKWDFYSSAETTYQTGGGENPPVVDAKESVYLISRMIRFVRDAVSWENDRALADYDEPGKTTANVGKIVYFEKDIHALYGRRSVLATAYLELSDCLMTAKERVWRSIKRAVTKGLRGDKYDYSEEAIHRNMHMQTYGYREHSRYSKGNFDIIVDDPIVNGDKNLMTKIADAVSVLKTDENDPESYLRPYEMPEYSQHDTSFMGTICPSTMILVPVSDDYDNRYRNNVPEANIKAADMELGVKTLALSLRHLSITGVERHVDSVFDDEDDGDDGIGGKYETVTTGYFDMLRTRRLDSRGAPEILPKHEVYYDEVTGLDGRQVHEAYRKVGQRKADQQKRRDKQLKFEQEERDSYNI